MKENYSLKEFNTMGFDIVTKYFYDITSIDSLKFIIDNQTFKQDKYLILGGGSNILFTEEYYDGIVIFSNIKGKEIIEDKQEYVTIRAYSGEVWKDFVDYCVEQGYHGLENLVDIPGSVGAAPVQNIGAYGSEVKDVISMVYCIDLEDGSKRIFTNEECNFSYRYSIFKEKCNKKYYIYAIDFKLYKNQALHIEYGNIREYLSNKGIENPTLKDVSDSIKTIRGAKLPELGVVGSVGSFFKNPIIDEKHFSQIKDNFPDIPFYNTEKGIKVPAAWLIDRCGWKGFRRGHVGVWDKQALVLVHYGGGCPNEIIELMRDIQSKVLDIFGIKIEAEVNIV